MRIRLILCFGLTLILASGTIQFPGIPGLESLSTGNFDVRAKDKDIRNPSNAAPNPNPTKPPAGPGPQPTSAPTPAPQPTATSRPQPTSTPGSQPTAAPPGVPTPRPTTAPQAPSVGARWSDPATWGGRVPTRDNDVVVPAGRVIEVDTLQAEARTVTIDGTLRASRGAASRLTVHGNLVVQNRGVLDYGRPADRVSVPASIRWFLDEGRYVGGHAAEPVASDVGLWGVDDSQVWVQGNYRDTWAPLQETARAGSNEIFVDPAWSRGWQVGDVVVVGPSNLRNSDTDQDEVRRITAVVGGGRFQVDSGLRFAHEVLPVQWTDTWGDVWTERLAAKVVNLTSNVTFEAGDSRHRPHVIFLDRAKFYVEDLAVVNFGPVPSRNPMVRYAWHPHVQFDGSRGSYARRMRIHGGQGWGFVIHKSSGVTAEDVAVYDQAKSVPGVGTIPFMLEHDSVNGIRYPAERQGHAADDCWIDRPLVMRWGTTNRDYRNSGFWLAGSVNCPIMGAVATGGSGASLSSGMHWPEGNAVDGDTPYVYRAEAHSNRVHGFASWQNQTPQQVIVDLLTWRNGDHGLFWGAYHTNYWGFQVRSLGNGVSQLGHVAANWGITTFLADGMGVSNSTGIRVGTYVANSGSDSAYEAGVIRRVARTLAHGQSPDPGGISHIQLSYVNLEPSGAVWFGGSGTPPPTSYFRFRNQQGLPRPSNFTLYRTDDRASASGAALDQQYNALRVDNDASGARPRPPRVIWTSPSDDAISAGSVLLTVQTDAPTVEFYLANQSLGRVNSIRGFASMSFNMGSHSRRRAYFWAMAVGSNGMSNTSRVLRVSRF